MQNKPIKLALAVSSFLPYTMSWIYRQINNDKINMNIVLTQNRENEEIFPSHFIHILHSSSYFIKAIQAKLWFWFGKRKIKLKRSEEKRTTNLLKNNQIELVHAHFGTYGVYFLPICLKLKIPLVVTFHGHDISSSFNRWPAYKKAFKDFTKQIKFAIVISEEMKKRIIQAGCPEDKIKVSYLGVPLNKFPYYDRSNNRGKLKFLHAGRLTAKKGVPDLIRAFKLAFPQEGEAELLIVGDGEEKEKVVETIKQNGLASSVKMLGRLSNEKLLEVRNKADVFVLNCRTDKMGTKEGLPISTLEAASTGLPAISTYHAGIPESIINEQTGFLVQEYDNAALAEAMIKMKDKKLRLEMGKNARRLMEQKFDLNKCNEVLYEIYQQAIMN